jgi:hypothetical protein
MASKERRESVIHFHLFIVKVVKAVSDEVVVGDPLEVHAMAAGRLLVGRSGA